MTGEAERSFQQKQPSSSKTRRWNSANKKSNVGPPEAEPSWTSWKTQALEAEPSCKLGKPWRQLGRWPIMGLIWDEHGSSWGQLGAHLGQLGPTWANTGQLGANLGPTWGQLDANLEQTGPTRVQLGANLTLIEGQLGARWVTLGQVGGNLGQHGLTGANVGSLGANLKPAWI